MRTRRVWTVFFVGCKYHYYCLRGELWCLFSAKHFPFLYLLCSLPPSQNLRDLTGNPFRCDCHIRPLIAFFLSTSQLTLLARSGATCQSNDGGAIGQSSQRMGIHLLHQDNCPGKIYCDNFLRVSMCALWKFRAIWRFAFTKMRGSDCR